MIWGVISRSLASGMSTAAAACPSENREFAAVAMLTAFGREHQLQFHLRAALHVGVSAQELEEVVNSGGAVCRVSRGNQYLAASETSDLRDSFG